MRQFAALLFIILGAASARAEEPEWRSLTVFQGREEAIAEVFAGADTVWAEEWSPSPDERRSLSERAGFPVTEESFTLHRGRRGSRDLGWAVVVDEIGLHEPITHLVKLDADLEVEEVRVLIFRETRGDAIKRPRFLKQFRGKSSRDRLQVGRDIDAVTGATYSSRAIVRGVRKVIGVVELVDEHRVASRP